MLEEKHEGNWLEITVMISISPALEIIPYWHCLVTGSSAVPQGLRSMFGGSAMFAVQCTAVKSGLLIAVSKEVRYIVYSLRCVFLPPASPDFGGIAYTAVVPATQEQDRLFFILANIRIISLQCWAMQKEARGDNALLEEINIWRWGVAKRVQLLMGIK